MLSHQALCISGKRVRGQRAQRHGTLSKFLGIEWLASAYFSGRTRDVITPSQREHALRSSVQSARNGHFHWRRNSRAWGMLDPRRPPPGASIPVLIITRKRHLRDRTSAQDPETSQASPARSDKAETYILMGWCKRPRGHLFDSENDPRVPSAMVRLHLAPVSPGVLPDFSPNPSAHTCRPLSYAHCREILQRRHTDKATSVSSLREATSTPQHLRLVKAAAETRYTRQGRQRDLCAMQGQQRARRVSWTHRSALQRNPLRRCIQHQVRGTRPLPSASV